MNILGWNREFALEQTAGDIDLLQELLDLFKISFENDVAKMEAGINCGNALQVTNAAHSIKGAAATLGIEGVTMLAKQIEQDARSGRVELAKELLPKLQQMQQELKEL
ncbi:MULTISPECIES: Hpt domain-containing protein [Desulfosediminicola]|uniref:Hpt domain-containing protein n=1 Tax=Desulfosediminicola TaxID=2886823 RepID=UPI0010AD01BE|nr:Hpt domain-containing protein [Desulfosediminicola ganghwensis]